MPTVLVSVVAPSPTQEKRNFGLETMNCCPHFREALIPFGGKNGFWVSPNACTSHEALDVSFDVIR